MNYKEYNINDIIYTFDYNGIPIISNINKTGEIYIPSKIEINNKIYENIGISLVFFENIKDKNITYFNVDINSISLCSINGILYEKKENKPDFVCIPPTLDISKLILPKNHYKEIYFNMYSINKNIKKIIIPNSIKKIKCTYGFIKYNDINFIYYYNKQLIKKNNKWILK